MSQHWTVSAWAKWSSREEKKKRFLSKQRGDIEPEAFRKSGLQEQEAFWDESWSLGWRRQGFCDMHHECIPPSFYLKKKNPVKKSCDVGLAQGRSMAWSSLEGGRWSHSGFKRIAQELIMRNLSGIFALTTIIMDYNNVCLLLKDVGALS